MEDRIAISRIKQGDLNGLEILVNRYQVRAVHAAYLVVYDRALAEDTVQTAFVKVAERIDQFDEQPRPFVFQIQAMISFYPLACLVFSVSDSQVPFSRVK